MIIRKKDYKTNTQKFKFMTSSFLGKDYLEDMIYESVTDGNIEIPVTGNLKYYVHTHLRSIVNKNIDDVWEYFWEDLSNAF